MSEPQQIAERASERMHSDDIASQNLGITPISVSPGQTKMSMLVRPDMLNGHQVCHGGFIFTLADTAFAHACNSFNEVTLAAGARIDFLATAHEGDRLTATACEVTRTRKTGIYDVVVRGEDEQTIAIFRGNSHTIGGSVSGEANE